MNNVVLTGRGDCDHLVLASTGVVVVETKAGGGQVRVVDAVW
jgi:Nuclease-related domain